MLQSASHDSLWAELSEAQRVESVLAGRATLKEIVAGLLDGPDKLREACREFLAHTDGSFEKLQVHAETFHPLASQPEFTPNEAAVPVAEKLITNYTVGELIDNAPKRRLGLPKNYVPRVYRH